MINTPRNKNPHSDITFDDDTSSPAAESAPNPTDPVSIDPARPTYDPSMSFENETQKDKVSTVGLVIDGLAAVIAVTFTILILQDVLPFLK